MNDETEILINPTGKFVIGSPDGTRANLRKL